MHIKVKILVAKVLVFLIISEGYSWELQDHLNSPITGTVVPFLAKEVDAWAASLLSQDQVPLVGAGAVLAYLGYAGAILLFDDEQSKTPSTSARSLSASTNSSDDFLADIASGIVQQTLVRTESAVAFRRAGARALQHGAVVLRRSLNAFSRAVAAIFSALTSGRRALQTDCVSGHLCKIGQMTAIRWPFLGIILRSLDSVELDEYAKAIIDGTTVGDCLAIYHNCSE